MILNREANAVSQNLRRRVYYHGMAATGTEEQWDEVWSRYEETSSGQEKDNLIYALAQTDRTWLMKRSVSHHYQVVVTRCVIVWPTSATLAKQ